MIEAVAALVTADLLDSEGGKKWTSWFNQQALKVGIREDTKFNPVTKAGITFIAGSGVAVFVEHREDPVRTRTQNMSYGIKNAALLAAACTAQGYLVTNGIANPDMLTIGGAVLAVGATAGLWGWARRRLGRTRN